jgi:hypothetical protein
MNDARPTNSLARLKSIDEVSQGYSSTDFGLVRSNLAAMQNAIALGPTATAVDWYNLNINKDYTEGQKVSQDVYDSSYAPKLGLDFDADETVEQLMYRIRKAAQLREINEQQSGVRRDLSQFGTSLVTGFLDPVNVAVSGATFGKGAVFGASRAAASARLTAAAGKPVLSALHSTTKNIRDYMLVSGGLEYGYSHMLNNVGVIDYTMDHFKHTAMSTVLFAGGLSALKFKSDYKRNAKIRDQYNAYKEYKDVMDGTIKDFRNPNLSTDEVSLRETNYGGEKVIEISQVLKNYGDEHVRKLIINDPRLKAISEGKVNPKDLTPEDAVNLASVFHQQEVGTLLGAITQDLALSYRNKDGSIVQNEKDFRSHVGRLADAITEGNFTKLTPEDITYLKDKYGLRIAEDAEIVSERTVIPDIGMISYSARDFGAEAKSPKTDPVKELQTSGELVGLAKGNHLEYKQMVVELTNIIGEALLGKAHVPVTVRSLPKGDIAMENFVWERIAGRKRPLGQVTFGKLGIEIADIYTMFDGDLRNAPTYALGARAGSTILHEFGHIMQDLTPKYYLELQEYVNSRPELKGILAKEIKRIGYEEDGQFVFDLDKFPWIEAIYPQYSYGNRARVPKTAVEEVPLLMEWYFTRPEFLNGLKKDKPNLFKRLMDILQKAFEKAVEVLRLNRKEFFKDMDNLKDADNVAATIKDILTRMRDEGASPTKLAQLKKGIAQSKDLKADSKQGPKPYQPSYKNPSLEARAKELGRQQADPIVYLESRIADIVGDEALVPMLLKLPKQSKGEKGRQDHIAQVITTLEENGLGYIVPVVDSIILNLQGSASRKAIVTRALRKDTTIEGVKSALSELKEAGAPPETLSRIGFILINQDATPGQKLGKIAKYLAEEDRAMVLRLLHNKTVEQNLIGKLSGTTLKKQKLKQLKTELDGSLREGVQRGPSVQNRIDAQIINDQIPLVEYVVDNDMLELFLGEDPTKYMSTYYNKNFSTQKAKKVYGENLEQASLAFHMDVMQSIRDNAVVDRMKGIKEFEDYIELVKTVNKSQLAAISKLGVNIRESNAFTGYSVTYSREVVESMGKKVFYDYMMKVLDADTTFKRHGGIMEDSKTGNIKEFVLSDFVNNMYTAIKAGEYAMDDVATANKSIAGVLRKTSKIAYKPEYQVEALVKFSNFKNHGRLLLDQIRGRSEKIALIKNLGHDPYASLMNVARTQGLTKTPGYKTFDMTAKQITGMLDNPVDVHMAKLFQNVRQGSNVLYLAGSGMSALSDVPLTIATLQYLDADFNFSTFVSSYKKAIDTQFRGKNKEMAAWYRSQGAGFDLLLRTIAQKVVTGEKVDGFMGFAGQVVFEVNGLQRLTATHQQIFIDVLSSSLAEAIQGKGSSKLVDRLLEFGFTPKELGSLVKYVEVAPDGIPRLAPSSVTRPRLQEKISSFYLQYMKEGVMEPDVGAQALSRLGLESGTLAGEAARTALQYSSFMLGMSRVVYRRFLHGYSGDNKSNGFKMAHLVTYIGMAIAFAYMTTIMKDLAKFREPINPLNMTKFDLLRILKQSGLLTIGELGVDAAVFGPSELFSPVTGQAIDLLKGDFGKALEPFTGQQYPVLGPVLEKAVGFVTGEAMLEMQKDLLERAEDAKIQE